MLRGGYRKLLYLVSLCSRVVVCFRNDLFCFIITTVTYLLHQKIEVVHTISTMSSEETTKVPKQDLVSSATAVAASTPSSTINNNKENEAQATTIKRDATSVSKNDEETSSHKRLKVEAVAPNDGGEASTSSTPVGGDTSAAQPLDLAVTLGHQPGDRFEVQWEIENTENTDPDTGNNNIQVYWWPATLLEFDGRTTDSVAIRTLHYDPNPNMGFPESSKEDVIFLGRDMLVSPDSTLELTYRKQGVSEEDQILWYNEGGMSEQLNTILMGALDKNKAAWKNLTPAQQAVMAEKIHKKKEKLLAILREQEGLITSATIHEVLQKAFT